MKRGVRFTIDFVYGMIGLAVMNAVTSLVVYPLLERRLGAAAQGQVLFFMAVLAVMAGAFGSAANYGRLKIRTEEGSTENGDYNIFLLSSALIFIPVMIFSTVMKGGRAGASIPGLLVLTAATVVRYYADVDFRMILNYRKFCCYYLAVAAGYGVGILLFIWTGSWVLLFLPGEVFGILFTVICGTIFRNRFFRTAGKFRSHLGTLYGLAGAYFLSDFVGLSDRLILPVIVPGGDELNAVYYYASLVGKVTSLLSTPLNGVLAGHLAKEEKIPSRRTFLRILGLLAGIFVVVTLLAFAGSYAFVWLFYRSHLEAAKPLFLVANAGQVLAFLGNTLMVIVLRYTHPRYQLITSAAYAAAYFALTIPLTLSFGITGMAIGILSVNALRFLLFSVFGLFGLKRGGMNEGGELQ